MPKKCTLFCLVEIKKRSYHVTSFVFGFITHVSIGSERRLQEGGKASQVPTFQVLHGVGECGFSCWQRGFFRHGAACPGVWSLACLLWLLVDTPSRGGSFGA